MKSSAIGIVFSKDKKKVLIIKRCDVPIWVFPGGGVEAGESPEVAVVREVKEETGLNVRIVKKIGEYTPINCLANYTHLYECQFIEGVLSTGGETRNLGFFSTSDLPHPFLPVHQDWLDDALLYSDEIIKKEISGTSWTKFCKFLFLHPVLMGRYLLSWIGLTINSKPEK